MINLLMMRQFSKNRSDVIISSNLRNGERVLRRELRQDMDSRKDHLVTKKAKRFRSAFTTEQVEYLEEQFRKFPYIATTQRKEVANTLRIPERAVKIWFQNRRMREKKESYREQNYDDQNNHNNVAFTNELLNNTPVIPSSHDRCRMSLPLLTSCEDTSKKYDSKTPIIHPEGHTGIWKPELNNEMIQKQHQPLIMNYEAISPVLQTPIDIPDYKSSGEFSINLCKKYRSDLLHNNKINQSNKSINFEDSPLQLTQDKSEDTKCSTQNVPEDLSYKRVKCKSVCDSINATVASNNNIPKTVSSNNIGFQPVYVANYAQPYLPAANMLWKPVNVMPIMSSGASATIYNNISGNLSVSQSMPKKPCNCECHLNVPNSVNITQNPQNPQAQYILTAVPFHNYPGIK